MNKKTRKFRAAKHSESGVNSEKDVKVFVGHDIGIWSNSGKKSVDSSVSGDCGWWNQDSRTGEDDSEWSNTGEDWNNLFSWMEPSDWRVG